MQTLILLSALAWPWGPWIPVQPAPLQYVQPVLPTAPPVAVRRGVFGRSIVLGQDGVVRVYDRFGRPF